MTVIRDLVYAQIKSVADQQSKTLPVLNDGMSMLESGLDSLCVAILIAGLDDELNVSPFEADNAGIPVTYGDLIGIYERATAGQ